VPGRVEVAARGAHLLGRLLVHVGQAGVDQGLGGAVHDVEIVAGKVEMAARALGVRRVRPLPAEAEPVHRVDDRVDVLLLLLLGIGVVEAQVADAAVVARQPEVQADALGVADVQVAVGLGREAGADARRVDRRHRMVRRITGRAGKATVGVGALGEVAFDDAAQEVAAGAGGLVGAAHGCMGMGLGGF
jgi:hypothetical protein